MKCKKKLSRITGETITYYPKKEYGICLFKLDFINKILFCDYNKIWIFIVKSQIDESVEPLSPYLVNSIKPFIKEILLEQDELKDFTPKWFWHSDKFHL